MLTTSLTDANILRVNRHVRRKFVVASGMSLRTKSYTFVTAVTVVIGTKFHPPGDQEQIGMACPRSGRGLASRVNASTHSAIPHDQGQLSVICDSTATSQR